MIHKTSAWSEALSEVERISHQSPTEIDPEIKELVTGLRAFGLPTSASCYGHAGQGGASHPWVEFHVPQPRSRRPAVWRLRILKTQKSLSNLIEDFERIHPPETFSDRLSLHFFRNHIRGLFYLQGQGAQLLDHLKRADERRISRQIKRRMRRFGRYLRCRASRQHVTGPYQHIRYRRSDRLPDGRAAGK